MIRILIKKKTEKLKSHIRKRNVEDVDKIERKEKIC